MNLDLNHLPRLQLYFSQHPLIDLQWISPLGSSHPPKVYSNHIPIYQGLLMIDEDAPYPERPTLSPILHWMHLGNHSEVPYMGPNPPRDSSPHTYDVIQVKGNLKQDFSPLKKYENKRMNFPLQKQFDKYGLQPIAIGRFQSSFKS